MTQAAQAGREAVLLDSRGTWTLKELGYGAQRFSLRRDLERLSVRYRLPSGATQGGRDWYLVRLHFALTLDPASREGLAYVSALTNGLAAAQVKIETSRRAGALAATWSTVGLLDGRVERTTSERTIAVRFRNYLQLGGVRGGRNTLTFQLEQLGGIQVRALRVLPDSGLEITHLSPARVRLAVGLPDTDVAVGDVFTVSYRLRNVGDRPATDVVVRPAFPEPAIALLGRRARRYAVLRGQVGGAFVFRALEAGRFQIALDVRSSSNRPAALIDVPIQAAESNAGGGRWVWPLALLALVAAAGAIALRRRRRGP